MDAARAVRRGFVTGETPPELAGGDERGYNVFVPMSPNPMGGFLAVVPESDLVETDMDVGDGLQMVVTTGLSGDAELDVDDVAAGHRGGG
ncbi:MAG: DUF502 domain-containing protein [Halobacteriaceae archaeon]